MPETPVILIDVNEGELGWNGNCHCPRQPSQENTKNMFCPQRENCVLAIIITRAANQKEARKIMSQAKLPNCKDGKHFQFQDQAPQFEHFVPYPNEADFVITR